MKNIVFLIYCARSGSTFLSRLLDEYPDIGVTVETRFMKSLLLLKPWFEKQGTPEELFSSLEKFGKFSNLKVGLEDFTLRFDGKHKISSVAEAILGAYFAREKPNALVWIIKYSANVYYLDRILKEIPDAKFIHIIRDGRAVLNSMLNTVDPYTRKPMSIDTLNTARYWEKYLACADKFKEDHPESILEIRYENLITHTDEEIKKIRNFIGLKPDLKKGIEVNPPVDYFDKIPEPEKGIHLLINSRPEVSRVNAWENKLPVPERRLFENIAGGMLEKKRYRVESKTSLYDIMNDSSMRNIFLTCIFKRAGRWLKNATDIKLISNLIEKLDSFIWFIKRPGLYPHLIHKVMNKILLPVEEDTGMKSVHWCEKNALDADAAIMRITGKKMGSPIEEIYQEIFKAANNSAEACPVKMGGPGDLNLLYYLAKYVSASRVIETGVAYGWSSLALLLAIKEQSRSKLISTDMPYVRMNNDDYVGCVVPETLKLFWKLIRLPDRQALPKALSELQVIDLCHYDSDKSYRGRMWAYPKLWSALRSNGVFISDDIGDNSAFQDFAEAIGVPPVIVRIPGSDGTIKYAGVLLKK